MTKTKDLTSDEVVAAIRDGADVRIEREDGFILSTAANGGSREVVGARVYLRVDPNHLADGRWVKTKLWLVRDPKNTDRPCTFAGVLSDLASVIAGPTADQQAEVGRAASQAP